MKLMFKDDILDTCSCLLDKITVLKGYLDLYSERNKIDYLFIVSREANEMESVIHKIVDTINNSA